MNDPRAANTPRTAKPKRLAWSPVVRPVIGMIHLAPLPGAPRYAGSLAAIRDRALTDAAILVEGGVHALVIENFGDTPFYPQVVPPQTIASMTTIIAALRQAVPVPLGVNVLRNDGLAALAIAQATGAAFIRVNVLCGARVTDQGLVEGKAHEILRARAHWQAAVEILADVQVKHSAPLAVRSVGEEVHDLVDRAGAQGVIVTGQATGHSPEVMELQAVQRAADCPVLVGSGVTADSLSLYWPWADGYIVGSSLKQHGLASDVVDRERVTRFMDRWKMLAAQGG